MNQKIVELKEWGCDVDAAMRRMLDDEEFYIDCLNDIPGDANFEGLKEALSKGEVSKAFDCAHTLKGVLANLGLTPMYDKSVEIVEPLRAGNGENLMGKMDELMEMKEHLTDILK